MIFLFHHHKHFKNNKIDNSIEGFRSVIYLINPTMFNFFLSSCFIIEALSRAATILLSINKLLFVSIVLFWPTSINVVLISFKLSHARYLLFLSGGFIHCKTSLFPLASHFACPLSHLRPIHQISSLVFVSFLLLMVLRS